MPAREEVRSVELPADGNNRKEGWFELIAGKSITWDGDAKCFSFVNGYDGKPKRRLIEVLQVQGYR